MNRLEALNDQVSSWGNAPDLPEYMRRKLRIFNILNIFGLLTGLFIPLAGILNHDELPWEAWVVAFSPVPISSIVLWLTGKKKHAAAFTLYFLFYPLFTALMYFRQTDLGLELFFILYGVLSVFFLNRLKTVILTCSYCFLGYLLSQILPQQGSIRLVDINPAFFIANQILAGFLIFYALFLIKNETVSFESQLKQQARKLASRNVEIRKQAQEIREKADRLEVQTQELAELNKLKNKLFSIVSHDLRNPVYALRNYFTMARQYDFSGEDVKKALPDIVNDLNYTTNLLENLLTWSKAQITASEIHPSRVDVKEMTEQVLMLMRLQAENKRIRLENKIAACPPVFADPDSVHLVLRNLISNAIKFSPEDSFIEIGASAEGKMVRVFVQDQGKGMSAEEVELLMKGEQFTVEGTSSEQGSGLGLLLCREYLAKNNGRLFIESEKGKGSRFSFLVPALAN
ncbi:sensor histidine kinase KdpD [Parasegetibacter sp. NRK P23]|uniref:sensor histidine kinase n=1 Tax=Parasegetibacter sp. NRK P23 TaxID=2942999 RepID=UPI00204380B0|nr:HAMP domain-containing sensor histidine kinase [Parasegetibacter sp. NRK P23]MCM5530544.1 HAMP domain-containing histidine kinase [Parasegetibacter sp. NRK P23]